MSFARKVIIAVDMQNNFEQMLLPLSQLALLKEAELELVHIFQTTSFAYGFGEYSLIYPIEGEKQKIAEAVEKKLEKVGQELFPGKKISCLCLFSDDPKDAFCRHAQERKSDLIIVAARRKRGIFESSFAQYVTKHSETHTLILKHHLD
jgi:nucleotide-binding universal stress UspA family protein